MKRGAPCARSQNSHGPFSGWWEEDRHLGFTGLSGGTNTVLYLSLESWVPPRQRTSPVSVGTLCWIHPPVSYQPLLRFLIDSSRYFVCPPASHGKLIFVKQIIWLFLFGKRAVVILSICGIRQIPYFCNPIPPCKKLIISLLLTLALSKAAMWSYIYWEWRVCNYCRFFEAVGVK